MATTFDSVVDKAKDVAGQAGKQAEKVVEISKLKLQVSQINSELKKAYAKLGSAVYNMKKADYTDDGLIDSVTGEIDDLLGRKKAAEKQLAALRKLTICPTCGAKNPMDALFCNKCGARIAKGEKED